MGDVSRREFMKLSTGVLAATGLSALPARPARAGANDTVVLAMIGVRGRAGNLMQGFASHEGFKIKTLVDIDSRHLPDAVRPRRGVAGDEARDGLRRLPQGARRQGHRRADRRHPGPLARDPHGLRLPGGQGRLRREARRAQHPRGPADGRGRPQVRPRRPDGRPVAERRPLRRGDRLPARAARSAGRSTPAPGRAGSRARSAGRPTRRSPKGSITTPGSARRRSGRSTRCDSTATGAGSSTTGPATWATTASTGSTWPGAAWKRR